MLFLIPFCGCETTIAAAQKLNRQWIGIDITHLSVGLMKLRLKDSFGIVPVGTKIPKSSPPYEGGVAPASGDGVVLSTNLDQRSVNANVENHPVGETPTPLLRKEGSFGAYRVIGQPEDLDGARELADKDKYGVQWWILPLIGARAFGAEKGSKEGKKGADGGIDGMMVFTDDNSGKAKKVIVLVRAGRNVNASHIRDLGHVIDRENAAIGVYLTLEPPTKPMLTEAAEKGFYKSEHFGSFPRLQILTVEEILNGKLPQLPPNLPATFKKADKVVAERKDQGKLGFD